MIEKTKTAGIAAGVFLIALGLILFFQAGGKAEPLPDTQSVDIKGAPIDAPYVTSPGLPENTPDGNAPTRVIPQASIDMLREAEDDSKNPLQFKRTKDGQFLRVTFSALTSFFFEPDLDWLTMKTDKPKPMGDRVPLEIKELNDKKVLIIGFMVPIEMDLETKKLKSFALTQNLAFCCYGVRPQLNELIIVQMGKGVMAEYRDNIPIAVYGEFQVGESADESNIASLYRMTASEVVTVQELMKREDD